MLLDACTASRSPAPFANADSPIAGSRDTRRIRTGSKSIVSRLSFVFVAWTYNRKDLVNASKLMTLAASVVAVAALAASLSAADKPADKPAEK